jgi:hypothetical protein
MGPEPLAFPAYSVTFAGGRGGFEWTDGQIGMDLGEVLGLLADLRKAYRPA